MGRKNWLFCGSEDGGRRAAVVYSLIESAKRIGLEPFEYLRDVLVRVRRTAEGDLVSLTPRGWRDARLARVDDRR